MVVSASEDDPVQRRQVGKKKKKKRVVPTLESEQESIIFIERPSDRQTDNFQHFTQNFYPRQIATNHNERSARL